MKNTFCINVSVESLDSLFSVLDPAPFRERDLDSRAVQHILQWAGDAPADLPIELKLHIYGKQPSEATASDVQQAVDNYFEYETQLKERQFKRNRNRMLRWLTAGIGLMIVLLTIKFFGQRIWPETFFTNVICEGFVIIGWVSLWVPIERLGYDGLLVNEELKLYRRLSVMEVHFSSEKNMASE